MYKYFIKIPWIIKKLFSSYTWQIPTNEKLVYLTFDDGPHPEITPWVLAELDRWKALATFFCIGKNVSLHSDVFNNIIAKNHSVGNHTYNHLNGWKTPTEDYLKDVAKAAELINTNLFRPPYGKIRRSQAKKIVSILDGEPKIIMWDVLSGDFDQSISKEKCVDNVLKNVRPGSIVVFHDSEKAFPHLQYALPKTLAFLSNEGYKFRQIQCPVIG